MLPQASQSHLSSNQTLATQPSSPTIPLMVEPRTPEERIQLLNGYAHMFNQHLLETPGIVLDGSWRWAVAVAARDALSCQGCSQLGQDACLRLGTAYEAIQNLEHTPLPVQKDAKIASTIANLVHTVINHQGKVDATWYEKTIKGLDDLGLIDANYTGESRRSLLASLYMEIVSVACMSHTTSMAAIAAGREAVPLPPASSVNQDLKPSMLDMTSLFRKGCSIRQDEARGFAPYFVASDLDPARVASALGPDAMHKLKSILIKPSPFLGLCFSPRDLLLEIGLCHNYLYNAKAHLFKPNASLDPKIHCSDVFSRYDKETMATAVAEAYQCHF